jgi:HSP20 family protein
MNMLVPWRTNVFDEMHKEMDHLMRRFFGTPVETVGNGQSGWMPQIDVAETDKAIVVKADIPGVDPKDVEVIVRDNALILRGEKKEEKEEKHKGYHRTERYVGSFFRTIPLPSGVDEGNIEATSGKGVITVTIPKKPEAQSKKITVKAKE